MDHAEVKRARSHEPRRAEPDLRMSSVIDMKPTPTRPSSDSPVPPPAPGLDRSVLVRAVELQGQHKTAEAEQLFRMYLGVYPDDPIAVYSLCVILLQRRDIKQALALLDH